MCARFHDSRSKRAYDLLVPSFFSQSIAIAPSMDASASNQIASFLSHPRSLHQVRCKSEVSFASYSDVQTDTDTLHLSHNQQVAGPRCLKWTWLIHQNRGHHFSCVLSSNHSKPKTILWELICDHSFFKWPRHFLPYKWMGFPKITFRYHHEIAHGDYL